ncbi:MAG TPA: family 20 glycosylhydrolase [Cyclobacteriaceae bacterium]|nr:family 20 glycosylhydrolase [Cyclobacteriaceae bacterium]
MKAYLRIVPLFILIATAVVFQSCKNEPPTDLTKASIIPKPVSVVATGKAFLLTSKSVIYVPNGNGELMEVAHRLASQLNEVTGYTNTIQATDQRPTEGIYLMMDGNDADLGNEGYDLVIEEDLITITANNPKGIFMGVQTLIQIVPLTPDKADSDKFRLAAGTVRDFPTYAWRGSMLDVARHFFTVDEVKRYIDYISFYKMNILHLHLSDDQGWRIEIKSWPNLATHGGSTEVGGGAGGFYTQEQYKDIVAYAASRYVTIVPEIDMPSHINSALASYGELNGGTKVPVEGIYKGALTTQGILDGKNKPTELYTGIEVGWSTLRLDKPATFKFVNDVIGELAAITPGPYIHIGGDEAHVTKKEDYIEFINRFTEIVKSNGKQMIGWEEIAQANIDNNAIAQHWTSEEYAQEAASKGARIIMSPSKKVYLDMQYDSASKLGLHWAAYIEVDESYNWDPASRVEGIDKSMILGVEAPLWSETIATMDDIEYLLFPRLQGVAEIAWSPAEGRSWDEYKIRLANHGPRMKAKGIDFYRSSRVPWVD